MASHNHINYQARLDYVQQLLEVHLGLSSEEAKWTEITPIQYEPDFPFKYNNFVYRLSLPADPPSSGSRDDCKECGLRQEPGCVPIPAGMREFILLLSNPDAEGMHQATRVQNEVAILTLASAALHLIEPNIVPRVFGWGGAGRGKQLGWILQERMPDNSGAIISAPMASVGSGPWPSLQDSYLGRLNVALAKADKNPHLGGWHANGVRERIEAFLERGLPAQFSDLMSKQDRVIAHADFTSDNLLYDPATGRITALLDYDFSSIQHPAYEFFRSFAGNGGQLTGWSGDATPEEKEAAALRGAKLTGRFPSPLPDPVPSANGPGVDWELAKAWEDELQRLDVKRPSTIQGIDKLADVDEVLGSLLPWRLTNEDFLRMNQDEGQRKALRDMGESQLVGLLSHMGF
ncbi:hypothetical protein GQ53DRAFT_845296 [Thozetella sp. PMI_491]|nr:hypothetical protein GQ53DRAFT_845296 [Thozetella sp. PMI_491]